MPTPPSRICRSAAPGCQTQRQRTQDGRGPAHDGSKRVPDRSSTKGATGDSGLRDRHTPLFLLADGTETSSACGVFACLFRRSQNVYVDSKPRSRVMIPLEPLVSKPNGDGFGKIGFSDVVLSVRPTYYACSPSVTVRHGRPALFGQGPTRPRACSWLPIFILDLSIPDRVAESRPLIGCRNSEDRILRKARAGEDGEEVARLRSR